MMPPKRTSRKAGKGKLSAVVDGLSTEQMSKDQLEEHIIGLREELNRQREERSYFQLERDKIQASWEISKRNLEEAEAELKNRQREREEAEERHRVEITVYKQKLKHVLAERHNTASSVASTSLIQNQHIESELGLHRKKQDLQADLREQNIHSETFIKELKLKHQVEIMELANDFDRKIRENEVKHQERMHSVIQAERKKRTTEVIELEDKMQRLVVTLTEDHGRAIREAVEFYAAIQERLLGEQKMMKKELEEVKEQQAEEHKELSAAKRENRRLKESLQESQQQLPELRKQLEHQSQKRAKATMAATRAQIKVTEKQLRDLKVEREWLLQAFEKVQQERDELLKKQTEAILNIQQKRNQRELMLERKLAALTETLEKKEAQLFAALSSSNINQSVGGSATNKLEEFEDQQQAS